MNNNENKSETQIKHKNLSRVRVLKRPNNTDPDKNDGIWKAAVKIHRIAKPAQQYCGMR